MGLLGHKQHFPCWAGLWAGCRTGLVCAAGPAVLTDTLTALPGSERSSSAGHSLAWASKAGISSTNSRGRLRIVFMRGNVCGSGCGFVCWDLFYPVICAPDFSRLQRTVKFWWDICLVWVPKPGLYCIIQMRSSVPCFVPSFQSPLNPFPIAFFSLTEP